MERGSRNVAVDGIKMVGMGNLGTGEEPLGNQESKDTLLVLYLMFFFSSGAGAIRTLFGKGREQEKHFSRC